MDQQIINTYTEKIASVANPQTPQEWKLHATLQPIALLLSNYQAILDQIRDTTALLSSDTDIDIQTLAQDDLVKLNTKRAEIEEQFQKAIEESAPSSSNYDNKNAILEIRGGTGGEEAALFASDLFRMYSQFAQGKGLSIEILDQHISGTGGIKQVIAKISGDNAFGHLKYESGVHRVQRVPTTESSGRIHTSTATVAVMPEAQEVDVDIRPEELRIDTYRSSGAGGQHVNKTDSAIRITHLPSGIVVSCQESRSQIKNRATAMSILRTKLYDKKLEEQHDKMDSMRKKQIGSAMRSEKIRTYNFPQSRVTDHRIKKSWHNLENILNGNLDEIVLEMEKTDSSTEK